MNKHLQEVNDALLYKEMYLEKWLFRVPFIWNTTSSNKRNVCMPEASSYSFYLRRYPQAPVVETRLRFKNPSMVLTTLRMHHGEILIKNVLKQMPLNTLSKDL